MKHRYVQAQHIRIGDMVATPDGVRAVDTIVRNGSRFEFHFGTGYVLEARATEGVGVR